MLSWPHRFTTPIGATLPDTLAETEANLAAVDLAPTCEEPAELVADKGYHSRDRLKELHDSAWKTRISEPAPPSGKDGILRWHGDEDARRAFYANRRRLLSGAARQALKLRAEIVERGFALTLLERGYPDDFHDFLLPRMRNAKPEKLINSD